MKTKQNLNEIKQYTTKELEEHIGDDQVLLVRQRLNHAISSLENPMQLRHLRRRVARMLTELRMRDINEQTKNISDGKKS